MYYRPGAAFQTNIANRAVNASILRYSWASPFTSSISDDDVPCNLYAVPDLRPLDHGLVIDGKTVVGHIFLVWSILARFVPSRAVEKDNPVLR